MKSSSSSSSVSRAAATKVHPNPFQNSISAARKQGAARTHFSLSTARDETSGAQKKNFGGLSVKAPPFPLSVSFSPLRGSRLHVGREGGGRGGNAPSAIAPSYRKAKGARRGKIFRSRKSFLHSPNIFPLLHTKYGGRGIDRRRPIRLQRGRTKLYLRSQPKGRGDGRERPICRM